MAACTHKAKSTDTSELTYWLNFILTLLEAKASFLLTSLPSTMDNIIDNLRSKDKTTWEDVYNHVFDLKSDNSTEESAYKA